MSKLSKLYTAQNKRCYWCNVQCMLPKKGKNTPHPPPNFATIDHLYSKLNPDRTPENRNEVVMACYKCNHSRGRLDCVQNFKEEHRRRSGTIPRKSERAVLNPVISETMYWSLFR